MVKKELKRSFFEFFATYENQKKVAFFCVPLKRTSILFKRTSVLFKRTSVLLKEPGLGISSFKKNETVKDLHLNRKGTQINFIDTVARWDRSRDLRITRKAS